MSVQASENIIPTPWDSHNFGFNTFEIVFNSEDEFRVTLDRLLLDKCSGHYTVKVDALRSKKILHEYGFYYCDTLIEPHCDPDRLVSYHKDGIRLSESTNINELTDISHGVFIHGRFHRDFNLTKDLADLRYDLWLKQLWEAGNVFSLIYLDDIAGFFGYSNNKILLHALSVKYQGKGLAKYFWSLACQRLFEKGYTELKSSISASNVTVVNLYSSLGFRFGNPLDVYHYFLE
jgi:Acetyltransferase (GNAT) domain